MVCVDVTNLVSKDAQDLKEKSQVSGQGVLALRHYCAKRLGG